jgi:hypothetical protein
MAVLSLYNFILHYHSNNATHGGRRWEYINEIRLFSWLELELLYFACHRHGFIEISNASSYVEKTSSKSGR